jgi:tetratricopeptide (TPR) repeat protein
VGGRRAEAERELMSALAADPSSGQVDRLLASFYLTGGNRVAAEPYLRAAAAAASGPGPKILLADFYLDDGRTPQAKAILEPLARDPAGAKPASLRLAGIQFVEGHHDEALATVTGLLARDPNDQRALIERGRLLFADRRYEEALSAADTVLRLDNRSTGGQYLRGLVLEATGALDEAAKAFESVLGIAPGSVQAELHLANVLLGLGDSASAAHRLVDVVKRQPSLGNAHFLLGRALWQAGDLSGAAAQFIPLGRANPGSAEIQTWLGHLASARKDYAEGRRAYDRALSLFPGSIDAFRGLLTIDIETKQFGTARARLQERLTPSASDPALWCLAGKSYVRIGDAGPAEAAFRRALQLDPSSLDAYLGLAGLYVFEHRLDEARAQYEAVARREAKPVVPTTLLGIILQLENKIEPAQEQYRRALTLDPRAAVAANNLAWLYAERGERLDEALRLIKAAKLQLPNNAQVSDTMGWVYYRTEATSLAIGALRQAAQQDPSDPAIHYHLGLSYFKHGDRPEARQELERALSINPRFDAADDARRVLKAIG